MSDERVLSEADINEVEEESFFPFDMKGTLIATIRDLQRQLSESHAEVQRLRKLTGSKVDSLTEKIDKLTASLQQPTEGSE